MRRTPPVVVLLQPQPAVQAVVTLIALLASGGLAAWVFSHVPQAWPVVLVLPLAIFSAWRAAAVQPRGALHQSNIQALFYSVVAEPQG